MNSLNNYQKSENRGTIRKSVLALLMIVMFTVIGELINSFCQKADYNG